MDLVHSYFSQHLDDDQPGKFCLVGLNKRNRLAIGDFSTQSSVQTQSCEVVTSIVQAVVTATPYEIRLGSSMGWQPFDFLH